MPWVPIRSTGTPSECTSKRTCPSEGLLSSLAASPPPSRTGTSCLSSGDSEESHILSSSRSSPDVVRPRQPDVSSPSLASRSSEPEALSTSVLDAGPFPSGPLVSEEIRYPQIHWLIIIFAMK